MSAIELKPKCDRAKAIFFLTAGELPSLSGLHASQVLEPALELVRAGYHVIWIASIPALSCLRKYRNIKSDLSKITDYCKKNAIVFQYKFEIWAMNGVFLFPFREKLLGFSAKRWLYAFEGYKEYDVVIHARSYYATQIAIGLRNQLSRTIKCCVSFDMRSLAPEEMPLTRGLLGCLYFGLYKEWEYRLVYESDMSFLPLVYASSRINFESSLDVIFMPIQGFAREKDWAPDFDARWEGRHVGFAGSFGKYQSPELLVKMVASLEGVNPYFACGPHPLLKGFSLDKFEFSKMKGYYDKLLVMVVPGVPTGQGYFVDFKMRCNFFSTKAAEALSLGVPLMVSTNLRELANFVIDNNCGLVYDPASEEIVYPENFDSLDKESWRKISVGADVVGADFDRSVILKKYMDRWSNFF